MMAVALTGRIGSGKSTVAALFRALGVPVLDLDGVGRTLQQQPEVVAQMADLLGQDIVGDDGLLDRARLRALCFDNPEQLQRLEALMHPLIWQQANAWRDRQQAPYGIIEASALRQRTRDIDCVIAVTADAELRRQRVLTRGRQTVRDFNRIEQLQSPPKADLLIENNGDTDLLRRKVKQMHDTLLGQTAGTPSLIS